MTYRCLAAVLHLTTFRLQMGCILDEKNPCDHQVTGIVSILLYMPLGHYYFLFRARSTATAIATDAPTIGLLPMPRKPIISTCAGTEEEPAN